MENIEKLLETAYKNNKTINIKEILELSLSDSEFEVVINKLTENGIIIDEDVMEDEESENFFSNSVKQYFSEMVKIPLLTAEEERILFEEYRNNRSYTNRNKLMEHNLRLVVSIAKSYRSRLQRSSNDILDIIQAGNIGLMKAIEKFDLEKKTKLSSYATWWIRQSIENYLNETSLVIRVPNGLVETYNKVLRFKKNQQKNNKPIPGIKEISKIIGVKESTVKRAIDAMERDFVSFDQFLSEDKRNTRGDLITVEGKGLEQEIEEKILCEEILKLMKCYLTQDEYYILTFRLGAKSEVNPEGIEKTLTEIGKEKGVTREAIRQKEQRALIKIQELVSWCEKINHKLKIK